MTPDLWFKEYLTAAEETGILAPGTTDDVIAKKVMDEIAVLEFMNEIAKQAGLNIGPLAPIKTSQIAEA